MSTAQIYDSINPDFFSDVDMEFVDYVYLFYGIPHKRLECEYINESETIYGKEFFPSTGGVTKAEIIMATKIRMLTATEDFPFDGDSMDREAVRDIMIKAQEKS
jgi:hypothetical protein|tara:strand:+ start:944 stop:1255 length:312 start_codon:yes stop_codon:yes gene_type:complete